MAYSGKYFPKNPSKYRGDVTNIWFRSLWERKAMDYFDNNSSVLEWSSEEIVIPYLSPIDNKYHRYFPDFLITVKDNNNQLKTILIEVKPYKQTQRPEPRKKTKAFIREVTEWGKNEAKWKAANEFCKDRNWQFKIITEKELNIK